MVFWRKIPTSSQTSAPSYAPIVTSNRSPVFFTHGCSLWNRSDFRACFMMRMSSSGISVCCMAKFIASYLLIFILYSLDLGTEFAVYTENITARGRYEKWLKDDYSYQYNCAPINRNSLRCNLCLNEKLEIALIKSNDNESIINSRSELVSKCRHINKFTLMRYDSKD